MAKSIGIRKTLELLLKKVETLENQTFMQKIHIDELENKLTSAEETIKKMKEDPWGLGPVTVPFVQPVAPPLTLPLPLPTAPYQPTYHVCTMSQPDWAGSTYCTICGTHMTGPTWTVTTNTSGGTTLELGDPASQSSSDVEPTLDLDISWIIPDEPTK